MILALIQQIYGTSMGKLAIGALSGAALIYFIAPSSIVREETREQVEKELTEKYEKQLSDKENTFAEERQTLHKELDETKTVSQKKEEEWKSKVESLTSEVSSLRKNTFTETVEIHKPDGTVEKRKTTHSTIETINEKVASVKKEEEKKTKEVLAKQEKKHQKELLEVTSSYKIEIERLNLEVSSRKATEKTLVEKHKEEIKGVRRLGLGLGYTTDKLYDFHAHYYILDALFLGTEIGTNLEEENRAAFVVGVSF